MLQVLSKEQATKELNAWLDFKKINSYKRETAEANIARLINALQDGAITIDPDTKVITQILKFPIGTTVTELKYKPRLTVKEIEECANNAPPIGVGRVLAYVSAATTELKGVVECMDAEDYHMAGDLVVFFMIPG